MGWYQALYEGKPRREEDPGPRPKGLRLLAAMAFSLFWLTACFAAWPGLEKYVFHTSEE